MTYVLRERVNNRYYCKDHNKIIEFDDIRDAHNFLNAFGQYAMAMAMERVMNDGPGILAEVQQVLNATTIDEKPNCDCKFINYKEILKEKGIY